MPSGITLPALHRVFQVALSWTNSHPHEFIINGEEAFDPARFDRDAVNRALERVRT